MLYNGAEALRQSKWIVTPQEFECPVIIKKFNVNNIKQAYITVSALGNFLLYLNGKRIGKEYFLPSNSLYCERNTAEFLYPIHSKFTYRCYYTVYNITEYIKNGCNTMEIALGNGWYRQTERTAEGNVAFGNRLGAIFAISFCDDSGDQIFNSDGSELCRTSNLVKSDLFYGEIYDSRIKEYQTAHTEIIELPHTLLTADDAPPDRIIRELEPRLIYSEDNRKLYDIGENISGFVTLQTSAPAGEKIRIRFSDAVKENKLSFIGTGDGYKSPAGKAQIMEDTVICNGETVVFEPQFLWHAFRYFEIYGDAEPLTAKEIHSDVPVTSHFECDCRELNWLYDSYIRGQLGNMHQGVPTDCPHRERLGYTGDGQVCAPAAMIMLDAKAFYKKWIRDIFDSQDKKSGHIPHTAPFAGGGGGPGGWGMAAITVPYYYYKIYGDITPAAENYSGIKKWIQYLCEHSENGLIIKEEPNGWCLGDWASPEAMRLEPVYVNTCLFIRALKFAKFIAEKLGKHEDAEHFEYIAKSAAYSVDEKFFDTATSDYAGGKQGANAFSLAAGLGNAETVENLKVFYKKLGCFDTGFLATDLLTEVLFENGEADTAIGLMSSHSVGGFGYQMDMGATTLWESWDYNNSLNHPMFGACSRMIFAGILGIGQEKESVGFEKTVISPKIPSQINFAHGYITVGNGKIEVNWKKDGNYIYYNIRIPESVSAVFETKEYKKILKHGENRFFLKIQDFEISEN